MQFARKSVSSQGVRLVVVVVALLAAACGGSPASPTPPAVSSITFNEVSPAPGSVLFVGPTSTGTYYLKNSGPLSIGMTLVSAKELPWATLSVYLLTTDEKHFCGQNSPDSPTWQFFAPNTPARLTVRGFQLTSALPCEVIGIRAMLHMRNNGSALPPSPSETIAEATLPMRYVIRAE